MKRKELTEQEINDICKEYNKGDTNLHNLADKYNCRTSTISKVLKENGIILRRHKGLSDKQEKQLCIDYENGMHLHKVAFKYHIRDTKVKDILKKYNIHIRKKGELLQTVLSDKDINQLCWDYLHGVTFEKLCDKYHIREERVDKILLEHNIFRRTKQTGAKNTFLTEEDINNIILDYKECFMPISLIINKYHISPKRLNKILEQNNVPQRDKVLSYGQAITEEICLKLDKNSDLQGKTLKDLINPETGCKLHPDIWMPKYKTIVEYDGEQHYRPIYGEENFSLIQKTDRIKEQYCKDKNYRIIRIDSRIFKNNKEEIEEYIVTKLIEFGYDINTKL